jgi:hypothetical protein
VVNHLLVHKTHLVSEPEYHPLLGVLLAPDKDGKLPHPNSDARRGGIVWNPPTEISSWG